MLALRPIFYSKRSILLLDLSQICATFSFVPSSRPGKEPSVVHRTKSLRHQTNMSASASQVKLSSDHCGVFHLPSVTKESAAKASQVLQENHEIHHCFFNASGFHSKSAKCILSPGSFPSHSLFVVFLTLPCRSYSSSHSDSVRSRSIPRTDSDAL